MRKRLSEKQLSREIDKDLIEFGKVSRNKKENEFIKVLEDVMNHVFKGRV